ncbi:MAG TPA: hypothetical protein DCW90_02030 [Lachnospiraceae bacterium]|nr:hypothetical protein [Lachnospiraceae bacterium]
MDIKIQLAELCAKQNLPMAKYKKLNAFSILEQEYDLLEKLESFHLPEITKLICGSEVLETLPWASKYHRVRSVYISPKKINVDKIIQECETVEAFENEVLQFLDADTLLIFLKYYDDLQQAQDLDSKEQTDLEKELKAKEKAQEKDISLTEEEVLEREQAISDLRNKIKATKQRLNNRDKCLQKNKEYIEKINIYESKSREIDVDKIREEAYRSLKNIKVSSEKEALNNFILSEVVSEEYRKQLRDPKFLNKTLQYLEADSLKGLSLPILLNLYDEGAIDIAEDPVNDFISRHPDRLCDYLVEKSPVSIQDLDNSERELLIEQALQKELSYVAEKHNSFFGKFWNTIAERDVWHWIISKVYEFVEDKNINSAISRLLLNLEGKAAKCLIEVLFDYTEDAIKFSSSEVISYLLKNSESSNRDVILETIRLLEQHNRMTQRKLNTSERKLRSYGQELFSSIYLPVEQLEELAINLKSTKGEVKANLIATHLIDIVLLLREGFEAFDVAPVENIEDWKNQNKIKFNPDTHRMTTDGDCAPDIVRLNSLGFRYQDDDGNWQQYNAHVFVEDDCDKVEKKARKGYPKYEQPGKKKSAGQNKSRAARKKK